MTFKGIGLWICPDQQDIADALVKSMDTELKIIGGEQADALDSWATNLELELVRDLRIFLSRCSSEQALPILLNPKSLQHELHKHLAEIKSPIISLGAPYENSPANPIPETVQLLPLFRFTNGSGQLQDALEGFGEVEAISINATSRNCESNTWSRLIECVDLLNRHLGLPERVHAVSCRQRGRQSSSLLEIEGPITANFRYPESKIGSLTLATGSSRWSTTASFFSEQGKIIVSESHCHWATPNGLVDSSEIPEIIKEPNKAFAKELSRQINLAAQQRLPIQAPPRWNEIFATANAFRLSMQTGEAEAVLNPNA